MSADPIKCRRGLALWIPGRAASKKTSQRIVRCGKFSKILPNVGWEPWAYRIAAEAVRLIHGPPPWKNRDRLGDLRILDRPWSSGPVSVRVLYTPENRRHMPDLSGLLESVGDALQLARIVENDRLIQSWDGSRITEPDSANCGTEIHVLDLDPEAVRVMRSP